MVRRDLVASLENLVKFAAHVTNPGDSVDQQEREHEVGSVGGGAIEIDVGVHVPQARDEVLAPGIDNMTCLRGNAGVNTGDSVPLDHHGGVGLGLACDRVDDGYVSDGKRLLCRCTQGQKGQDESELFWNIHF